MKNIVRNLRAPFKDKMFCLALKVKLFLSVIFRHIFVLISIVVEHFRLIRYVKVKTYRSLFN